MIYFLSDAHIGSRAIDNRDEHQTKVVNLLQGMEQDAKAVYLLGDIFDFWMEYFWKDKDKEEYKPLLHQLRHMTERGIEVHFFVGNHDLWTFGWLEKQTGVIVHKQPMSAVIQGKNVYLAHGDGLVPQKWKEQDNINALSKEDRKRIRTFIFLRKVFHNWIAQGIFRLLPPSLGNRLGYNWARQSRMKELAHPCLYKGENKEEQVLAAKETYVPQTNGRLYDFYIFGHRHIDLDLMISHESRVVILGDLFKTWSYAQMDEEGNVRLEYLE